MAMASVVKYVKDPAQAGFATSMFSVVGNLGVAFVPVFLGPVFISAPSVAVGITVAAEFAALIIAFFLKSKQ